MHVFRTVTPLPSVSHMIARLYINEYISAHKSLFRASHTVVQHYIGYHGSPSHLSGLPLMLRKLPERNCDRCLLEACSLLHSNERSVYRRQVRPPSSKNDLIQRQLTVSAKEFVASSPHSLKPYLELMRIDRPIGTWLVYLPCAWSISMAAPAGHLPDLKLLTLCALGAFFMRGAGCTINDMWDRNYDAQVFRTQDRPLASGRISQFNALVFLAMPLSASLAILLTFDTNTIILGFCSVLPCVIYPLMKRITYWPQIFLGMTFNWGAVMGWSAVHGHLHPAVLPLYISALAWTVVYDTIYAFQDKEDDIKIGVRSTALRFGESSKYWLTGFASIVSAGLTTTGLLTDQTWPYYLGVTFFSGHLAHQIYSVDLSNADDCGNKFRSNRFLGLVFWASIVASTLLRTKRDDDKQVEPNYS